jgi:hypothetical protein
MGFGAEAKSSSQDLAGRDLFVGVRGSPGPVLKKGNNLVGRRLNAVLGAARRDGDNIRC